jgi:hypothetical protein
MISALLMRLTGMKLLTTWPSWLASDYLAEERILQQGVK